MDISEANRAPDRTDARASAAEMAQAIESPNIPIPGITLRTGILVLGAIGFLFIVAASRFYNVPTQLVVTQPIATENALTYYSTAAGIAGFVGSLIASNRLASIEADTVTVGSMAAPVLVTAAGNVIAGFLFPSG